MDQVNFNVLLVQATLYNMEEFANVIMDQLPKIINAQLPAAQVEIKLITLLKPAMIYVQLKIAILAVI